MGHLRGEWGGCGSEGDRVRRESNPNRGRCFKSLGHQLTGHPWSCGSFNGSEEQSTAQTLRGPDSHSAGDSAGLLFSAPQVSCLQLATAYLSSPAHPPIPFCPLSKVCASVLQPSPWLAPGPTQVRRSKSPSYPQQPFSKVRTLARAQLARVQTPSPPSPSTQLGQPGTGATTQGRMTRTLATFTRTSSEELPVQAIMMGWEGQWEASCWFHSPTPPVPKQNLSPAVLGGPRHI